MKITELFSSSQDALGILKTTRNAAAIAAAITGMGIVATIAYSGTAEYMPKFFAYIFSLFAVVIVLFVVDYGFRQTLPFGLDLLISGHAWRDWRTFVFMSLLLGWNFVQGFASIKLSWEGRKEAIAAIQKEPDLKDVAVIKNQVDRTSTAKIRTLDSEIRDLREEIKRREKEVERLNPDLIERIESGKDKYQWAAGQIEKKKKAKTADLDQQLSALLSARTAAINAETKSAQMAIESVTFQNADKWSDYQTSKTRNMAYIGYFGSGCTFAVFILSLMISLLGQSDVKGIEQKTVQSPVRKSTAPPHVAPARNVSDDFELKRQVETLMAKVETFQRENETVRPETVETVSRETETVNGPKTVSVSVGETVSFDIETVKGAVKEAVREVAPETVETVRETVETEMKRKPAVETVKPTPPIRKKVETFQVETDRACDHCGGSMKGKRSNARFCSPQCKTEHHNAKR